MFTFCSWSHKKGKARTKLKPSRFRRNEKTFDKKFARDLGIHSRAGRINFFGTTWGAFQVEKRVRKFRCEFQGISLWEKASFGKKIRKFRFEVNFPEIPFGNCGVPSEVLRFFRSERNGGNFLTICKTFQFPVSHQPKTITGNRIANGKRHFVRLVW